MEEENAILQSFDISNFSQEIEQWHVPLFIFWKYFVFLFYKILNYRRDSITMALNGSRNKIIYDLLQRISSANSLGREILLSKLRRFLSEQQFQFVCQNI